MKIQNVRNAFLISFAIAIVLSLSFGASAKWTRTHAFDCKTLGGAPVDVSYALHNYHITNEMYVLCAVTDTDQYRKGNITTLNVHGFDGHTSLRAAAMACRSTWSVTGGSCGSMAQSATYQQQYTLQPSLSQWTQSTYADFGYVWIRLPRMGAAASNFRGYYTNGS